MIHLILMILLPSLLPQFLPMCKDYSRKISHYTLKSKAAFYRYYRYSKKIYFFIGNLFLEHIKKENSILN